MDLVIAAIVLDIHGDAPGSILSLILRWKAVARPAMIRINFQSNTCD
jgi:hypothetical protein